MKFAIMATALIGAATMAAADDTVHVIGSEPAGNGAYEVTSQYNGFFTLHRVACLPMMAGVLDQADNVADLNGGGSADMIEVVRGTTEHAIASYACEG